MQTLLRCKAKDGIYQNETVFRRSCFTVLILAAFKVELFLDFFQYLFLLLCVHANFETLKKKFVCCEGMNSRSSSYLETGNGLWLNFRSL